MEDKEKVRTPHSVWCVAEGLAGRERLIQLDQPCAQSLESWQVKEDKEISRVHRVYLSPSLSRVMFNLMCARVSKDQ